jgi:hypothetical protein
MVSVSFVVWRKPTGDFQQIIVMRIISQEVFYVCVVIRELEHLKIMFRI